MSLDIILTRRSSGWKAKIPINRRGTMSNGSADGLVHGTDGLRRGWGRLQGPRHVVAM